ncbi:MAG TPA: hypothetical protein VIP80_04845 [Gemmatimonadales bacterium]
MLAFSERSGQPHRAAPLAGGILGRTGRGEQLTGRCDGGLQQPADAVAGHGKTEQQED